MTSDPILVGRIGAAHGIRGEVRVKAFTEPAEALGDYGPLMLPDGRRLTIERMRDQGTMLVVKFREIADRTAAERFNGLDLTIERSALPAPDDEETFYHADLVGLAVVDGTGDTLGRIVAVPNFGAGDLLEVQPAEGGTYYLPFTRAFVPTVDVAGGRVTVELPADFFDTEEPTDAETGDDA
ncbi:ribosome maturation factor RimM [Siculibacillus lacustris]|uniref:Ribosome maturation factor RimM n=1 Tax=Siculibacillus lacustris TaxID=1549641 RepID=A0A4Q9VM21_9HYPH|nr:ribosome maturation factor RimM [Siculibacillus lacustris]TBW36322.1 ribosome maturation factor RimM [Siculibacillus lacustris]